MPKGNIRHDWKIFRERLSHAQMPPPASSFSDLQQRVQERSGWNLFRYRLAHYQWPAPSYVWHWIRHFLASGHPAWQRTRRAVLLAFLAGLFIGMMLIALYERWRAPRPGRLVQELAWPEQPVAIPASGSQQVQQTSELVSGKHDRPQPAVGQVSAVPTAPESLLGTMSAGKEGSSSSLLASHSADNTYKAAGGSDLYSVSGQKPGPLSSDTTPIFAPSSGEVHASLSKLPSHREGLILPSPLDYPTRSLAYRSVDEAPARRSPAPVWFIEGQVEGHYSRWTAAQPPSELSGHRPAPLWTPGFSVALGMGLSPRTDAFITIARSTGGMRFAGGDEIRTSERLVGAGLAVRIPFQTLQFRDIRLKATLWLAEQIANPPYRELKIARYAPTADVGLKAQRPLSSQLWWGWQAGLRFTWQDIDTRSGLQIPYHVYGGLFIQFRYQD